MSRANTRRPSTTHYVVIVLGLGEAAPLYRLLVRNWPKRYGLQPVIFTIGWHNKKASLASRLRALSELLEEYCRMEATISVIGISAGASASLNALCANNIHIKSYVSVCGRFSFEHHRWYPLWYGVDRSPLFRQSVAQAMLHVSRPPAILPWQRAVCLSSVLDEVVPYAASVFPQADNQRIAIPFHNPAIYSLFMFPRRLIRYLQN